MLFDTKFVVFSGFLTDSILLNCEDHIILSKFYILTKNKKAGFLSENPLE